MFAVLAGHVTAGQRIGRAVLGGLDLFRDLLTDDYGVIIMCASMGREMSWENDAWQHGAFTKAVIEGPAVFEPIAANRLLLRSGRAIGRYFAKALSGMILCIGYMMAGFDSQKRALHDRRLQESFSLIAAEV